MNLRPQRGNRFVSFAHMHAHSGWRDTFLKHVCSFQEHVFTLNYSIELQTRITLQRHGFPTRSQRIDSMLQKMLTHSQNVTIHC
jgi:hypothetical protein